MSVEKTVFLFDVIHTKDLNLGSSLLFDHKISVYERNTICVLATFTATVVDCVVGICCLGGEKFPPDTRIRAPLCLTSP